MPPHRNTRANRLAAAGWEILPQVHMPREYVEDVRRHVEQMEAERERIAETRSKPGPATKKKPAAG